jgi:methylated-DNA-protein-cysteine methyltransferase-like protein
LAASAPFANINRAVLWAARSIPAGKVSTAADIGKAFNIPPRHVAYILSQLGADEREFVPAHRIVPGNGVFPAHAMRTDSQRSATALLRREGVELDPRGKIVTYDACRMHWPDTWATTIWAEESDGPWSGQ